MDLTWSVSEASDFLAYKLYRGSSASVDENSTLITTITNRYTLSYIATALTEGTEYYFRVYVVDASGQTSGSNIVNAATLAEPGTWGVQATISGSNLYGIDVLNENFAVAVGESGKVYFYDGSIWSEQETMATETLRGVAVISETDIYVVGDEGVIHYNGTIWNQPAGGAPTTLCYCIEYASASDVWIGADNGAVWHYNGTNWIETSMGGSSYISDIQIDNSESGWAINEGEVYRFNGVAWSLVTDFPSYSHGVQVINSNDIWVVRDHSLNNVGGIMHWDGSNISYGGAASADYFAVGGESPSDVWFLGESGHIRHWDGDAVTDYVSPTTRDLNAIKMISVEDGWAVGNNGVVLRYH